VYQRIKDGGILIFFDNLAMLELYHSQEELIKFAYFLNAKAQVENLQCIFMATKAETRERLFRELKNISQKFIEL
jgi:hypothetical protein